MFYLFVEKEAKVYDESEVVAVRTSGMALPFFFANALYTYEGVGMVTPVCLSRFYCIHVDTSTGKQNEGTKKLSQSAVLCYDLCDSDIRCHRNTGLFGIR